MVFQETVHHHQLFKMNLFDAALTPELWSIVAQQDQEAMRIQKMYQVATEAQREGKGKGMATVSEIRNEKILAEPEDNNNNMATFNQRGARQKTNHSGSQSNRGRYASGRGSYQAGSRFNKQGGSSCRNNAIQNNKYCYFCKQQGHRQEECRKRIKENKPCQNAQGQTNWPRIYLEENSDPKSVSAIGCSENRFQDDYKEP